MKTTLIDIFIVWPLPLVWLATAGLLLWVFARRLGRFLIVFAALLLVAGSVPIIGQSLHRPLAAVPVYRPLDAAPASVQAIVVPGAGIKSDSRGEWWGTVISHRRLADGQRLAEATGLPLYVAGGAMRPGEPSEARVLVARAGLAADAVRLEETARNTAETGAAVAALLADDFPDVDRRRVVVVTSRSHVLRMAASLRRHGVDVAVYPAPRFDTDAMAFVPSRDGFSLTAEAVHEYAGLAWYLLRGYIRWRDLDSDGEPGPITVRSP